jgi:5-methyltetrahydrofolate--homocysteine methyltransferase
VVASLLDPRQREAFVAENRRKQEELRAVYGRRGERRLRPYAEALANRFRLEWREADLPQPEFLGRRLVRPSVAELVPYIDWTFFFVAWELRGRFPQILDHPRHGEAARELFQHGQALLRRIADEKLLTPRGVYGFWPAASDGDDIALFSDESRCREILRFCMLRQQAAAPEGGPSLSLADFVAPRESGLRDHVGAFAVTSGAEAAELAAGFERALDDYHAIMVKALADRLAEAFAEWLHRRAREDWAYGRGEDLTNEELIAEKYRGIRPAFGYPACPDHSEKRKLFELLGAPEAGIRLTESCAMWPAASVSGIYLAHPKARYFTVGRVGRDQVAAYAARKGMPVAEVERWLAPNLGYDPEG